jgi:hypothetical protein
MDTEVKIQQFAKALLWARRQAGDPSYRELHRRMSYSIASICRVLSGKSFPRWEFTEEFLRACRISDERIAGLWHARWLEIAELISPLGDHPYHDDAYAEGELGLRPDSSSQVGTECPECGALVVSLLRHQAWHLNYARRPGSGRTWPRAPAV